MEIRALLATDDRLAVSRVYEESWKYAYQGIIPQEYLDSIPVGRWASGLSKEGMHTLIMLEQENIIGTSSYCQSRFADMTGFGEIVSIYLLPAYIGKGYGRKLLYAVLHELSDMGFQDVFLWCSKKMSKQGAFMNNADFHATAAI